jgi:hypothetical protein
MQCILTCHEDAVWADRGRETHLLDKLIHADIAKYYDSAVLDTLHATAKSKNSYLKFF